VVRTWGSAPQRPGSHLAMAQDGRSVGSVSSGCIEGELIGVARSVIADGRPRLLPFGVSDEQAWRCGQVCGGSLEVFVERVE
jgi:xanthine/CO dehydrogenase XdhC/CoxF family maturation factor